VIRPSVRLFIPLPVCPCTLSSKRCILGLRSYCRSLRNTGTGTSYSGQKTPRMAGLQSFRANLGRQRLVDTTCIGTIRYDTIRYDIRDVILTCARKPTRVSLIYRTETTTKNCKTVKLKSKNRCARSNKSGESCSQSRRSKNGCSGKDLQKRKVLSLE